MKRKRAKYFIVLLFIFGMSYNIFPQEKENIYIDYIQANRNKLFFVSLQDYHSAVYGDTQIVFAINIVDQKGMVVEFDNELIINLFFIKYDLNRNAFIREEYYRSLLLMSHYDNLLQEMYKINFKVVNGDELYQLMTKAEENQLQ